jgi:hypothetical protein
MAPNPLACLGAPYLYVSLRDETSNIVKYSRDGCLLSNNIADITSVAETYFDVAFRGMAMGSYHGKEALYVADASPHNARVVVFGECNKVGMRQSKAIVVDGFQNAGVIHTEGVTFDRDQNIYISNRNTDSILRFSKESFKPMPLPDGLALAQQPSSTFYEGTFIQFGAPKVHQDPDDAVRTVAYAEGKFWVAAAELSGVALVDERSGEVLNVIPMDGPIALHYEPALRLMFISCKSRVTGGIVFAISTENMQLVHSYRQENLFHPIGKYDYENYTYEVQL